MPHYAADERHELAQTLRATRPDAPTLCGEWDAAHLAAHLVLRERSALEGLGRVAAPLTSRADSALDRTVAERSYSELVDAVASGPSLRDLPLGWLWSLPPVREQANLLEYVIHHEDVRRAGHVEDGGESWEPRLLPVDRQRAIWSRLRLMARLNLRRIPVRLTLDWPSQGTITAGSRKVSSAVTVSGDPVELALLAFGRERAARLTWDGVAADIERVRSADVSF